MTNVETLYLISTISNLHEVFLGLSVAFWIFLSVIIFLHIATDGFHNLLENKWLLTVVIFATFLFTFLTALTPTKKDFVFIYSGANIIESSTKDSTIKNDDEMRGKMIRILTEESAKLDVSSN